jgi:hypothetical protein
MGLLELRLWCLTFGFSFSVLMNWTFLYDKKLVYYGLLYWDDNLHNPYLNYEKCFPLDILFGVKMHVHMFTNLVYIF